ncbi:restriction endonuclease subunit S [Enterobacter hormaechei]|uniref:restriction endonuclease subunit S n=1 Tax=Enterobacter cloacae complex TaxID=354276 RepID=UPI000666C946|nr:MULTISPECIES: restriction endonuclease subunit S [Enterobacter cloacae complex]EJK8587200.1 restriction endonuclease subunit S [Enterobacter hormaechei]EKT6269343.1 restriction endonuclease subunit S [Escherichia coli]EKT9840607.1 restriction endonuclease subunit S [Enterobacter hormaechei]ELD3417144.1 restriction endonuclease subunit S [Enterobacter hormaechei]MBG0684505.1 restriction endonuclease subunit S [Enterobacter kobei]
MSELSYLEKLLDGVEVEWLSLGELGDFIRGNGLQKKDFVESGFPAIHYGQIYTRYGLSADKTFTYVLPELANKLRKAQKNDLLLATTSENDEDVVKPLAWLGDNVAISGDMMLFRHEQNVKYLAYFFQSEIFQTQKMKYITGAKVRRVSSGDLSKIKIPIPSSNNPEKSLTIQSEIVRILDKFTALTAELTAELTMRKKQYNYYRDKLLSFEEGGVEWKTLGEIVKMRAGQHISARNIVDGKEGDFVYPCFGGNGIRGYVKEKSHDGEHLLIGRQGALCGNVQRMKGQFYATEHAVVVSAMQGIDIDWAFHMLTTMNLNQYASKSAQPGLAVGKLQELKLLVPSIERQKYIAKILDKFDTLTSSITEGLPREIELRQKQYEYYRDLLFSFPKPETASN